MGMGKRKKKGKAPLVSVTGSDFFAHGLLPNLPLQGKDSSLRAPSKGGQQSKPAGGSTDLCLPFIRGEGALRDRAGKRQEKEAGRTLHRTCGDAASGKGS